MPDALVLRVNEWFRLPRLGPEAFRALMAARVRYDRSKGFMIDELTDVERVRVVLTSALGKSVLIQSPEESIVCFTCGSGLDCPSCHYFSACPRDNPYCVCEAHTSGPDAYSRYVERFEAQAKKLRPTPKPSAVEEEAPARAVSAPWTEKYRPTSLSRMVGNERQRLDLLESLREFKGKPILLLGPPGTGKTTLVHLAAREFGFSLIEVNASAVRTKDSLEKKIGPALTSATVMGEERLVFLDEVDGISGRADYGGLEFIRAIMSEGRLRLVMAANAEDSDVLAKISGENFRNVRLIRFRRLLPRQVALYLNHIASLEGPVEEERLRAIVERSRGDLRWAINALQAEVKARTGVFERPDLAGKDEELSVRQTFLRIFKAKSPQEAYQALNSCDWADAREKLVTAYNNIVFNATGKGLLDALRRLSDLDVLVYLITVKKNYQLLRYFNRLLVHLLYDAKEESWSYREHDELYWSLRFKIWNDGKALREVAAKMAKLLHTSSKTVLAVDLPFCAFMCSKDKGLAESLAEQLGLNDAAWRALERYAERLQRQTKK